MQLLTLRLGLTSLVVTENDLTSDNVFIDTSLIANATITSNNANALFAKSNDVISITFDTNVRLHNATLDILGTTVDMTVANKTAFTTVTVLSNAPNGPIMFDITAHDDAHNRFAITENNLTSNSVTIDTSKPNLTNLTIYSNNANASLATVNNILNITLTADDVIKDATITILGIVLRYIYACICHCTAYTHHVCRAQDCNGCIFYDIICGECDV